MYHSSVREKLDLKMKDTEYEKLGDISFIRDFPGYYDGRL